MKSRHEANRHAPTKWTDIITLFDFMKGFQAALP